ncbi:flavin reductase family protein [Magnetofaba australis]|nr:flavin reductase family protein [Magnetofaba australis]
MLVDFNALSPSQIYFAMSQTITPRPIAWILSDNGDGGFNLAPFSYFNGVCSDPPLIMFSVGAKRDGAPKDTRANIALRSNFVVHIPHSGQVEAVEKSGDALPPGESELTALGLETVPFGGFPLPRLRDCRAAFACELYRMDLIGNAPQAIIYGRIRSMWLDDAVGAHDAKGRLSVDATALDALGRLGNEYSALGPLLRPGASAPAAPKPAPTPAAAVKPVPAPKPVMEEEPPVDPNDPKAVRRAKRRQHKKAHLSDLRHQIDMVLGGPDYAQTSYEKRQELAEWLMDKLQRAKWVDEHVIATELYLLRHDHPERFH